MIILVYQKKIKVSVLIFKMQSLIIFQKYILYKIFYFYQKKSQFTSKKKSLLCAERM